MFVSLLVVGLHFLPYFVSTGSIGDSLIIPDWGMALSALTFSVSFLLYLWAPRNRILPASLAVYLLLAITAAALVFSTGGAHSSFIALWIVIAVFASVFGLWGMLSLLSLVIGYEIYLALLTPPATLEALIIIAVAGVAPLIASYIIFHTRTKSPAKDDAAYHALASELNQVTNKSDVVIRAIDDGVIAIDAKGVIELMNPAAQRIIGWGKSDALGLDYRSVLKLYDKENKPLTETNDPIVHVLSSNQDVHTKAFATVTNGGKRIALSLVVSPIGQIGEGAIIAFRDITKEAAEEREQAEFISTASHEMRTPVASIEGYLGLALNPNTAQVDEKAREFIKKAQESAQHLGRLFQDLLDVSKAEDGRLSNHPSVVDVVSYLSTVVESLQPKAKEKQLRLYYKPEPDGDEVENRRISPVFYVNVDQDHLREIISNFIENAIKYTPSGDIIVDVTGDDDHVRVSVQDSGIGIPREDIPHLFQKFYRVDNSATREIGGTGLGLYLCRRLSEVMGGRLWVESEFQKGSTFYLELPRLAREEAMQMLDAASTKITAENIVSASQPIPLSADSGLAGDDEQAVSLLDPVPAPVSPASKPNNESPIPTEPSAAGPISSTGAQQPTLATIEKNPTFYTDRRTKPPIQVPVRDHNQANQS